MTSIRGKRLDTVFGQKKKKNGDPTSELSAGPSTASTEKTDSATIDQYMEEICISFRVLFAACRSDLHWNPSRHNG